MQWSGNWSDWALGTYQRCGLYFFFKFIEGKDFPYSLSGARGSSVHAQAETSFLRKMQGQPLLTPGEAAEAAAGEFDRIEQERGIAIRPEELQEYGTQEKATGFHKDEAVQLSKLHASVLAPHVEPVAVEQRVEVDFRDFVVSCVIDLVDKQERMIPIVEPSAGPIARAQASDYERKEILITRDLKTRRKPPKKEEAATSQQLTFQAIATTTFFEKTPEVFALDVLYRTPKTGIMKYVPSLSTRNEEDMNELLLRIWKTVEAVKKGVFLPAPADHWFCSPQYCEAWSGCPHAQKRPVLVQIEGGE